MSNTLGYSWIICFILSYLLHVLIPFIVGDGKSGETDRLSFFLYSVAWILSLTGFIIFIIWLTRFNNISILRTLWISSLITWIVSVGVIIFSLGNADYKIINIFGSTFGYALTIFIGSLITFLVKNK